VDKAYSDKIKPGYIASFLAALVLFGILRSFLCNSAVFDKRQRMAADHLDTFFGGLHCFNGFSHIEIQAS
jgi:hypothetical protein